MEYGKQEIAESRARLLEWLKPGDTVYTILRNVSRSGMRREIGIVLMNGDHGPTHPNYSVAVVLGDRLGKRDGIIVGGCGMDMGFHLVYNLGRTLFPEGFGIEMEKGGGKKVPKTKEQAEYLFKRGYRSSGRNRDDSGWDNDGGYALSHRWL